MQKWFQRSLLLSSAYFIGLFVSIMLYAFNPEGSAIAEFANSLAVAIICTAPIVLILMLISYIGMLRQKNDAFLEKRKRGWATDFYSSDEQRLREILDTLSADDRAFVESKLAGRSYRLREDGEIVSFSELLDDQQRGRSR